MRFQSYRHVQVYVSVFPQRNACRGRKSEIVKVIMTRAKQATLADKLRQLPVIFQWAVTTDRHHESRVETWGNRLPSTYWWIQKIQVGREQEEWVKQCAIALLPASGHLHNCSFLEVQCELRTSRPMLRNSAHDADNRPPATRGDLGAPAAQILLSALNDPSTPDCERQCQHTRLVTCVGSAR